MGTGYSRAKKPELGKKFWGVEGDIQSVGEFIRLYLTRHERWASPLFLVGESYGTTRAAGLSGHLVDRGHRLQRHHARLVDPELPDRALHPRQRPALSAVPADLRRHRLVPRRLPADLQQQPLREVLDEVEAWAAVDYPAALAKGDRLAGAERTAAVDRLARYTGLRQDYVEQSDLRIEIQRFCKELLRDQQAHGGPPGQPLQGDRPRARRARRPDYDPSLAAIRPPYTATFNDYVRRSLGLQDAT